MNKKIIVSVFVAIALLVGGIVLWSSMQAKKETPALVSPIDQSTVPVANLVLWDDPLGFTFKYPEDVSIDKHDEDQENYAHVELTHSKHPGKLIVWAKDTTATDVTAWVKTEKKFVDASVIDTTLGGVSAKKILVNAPEGLFIGAIADELLFLIEVSLDDKEYWTTVAQVALDSFVFKESLVGVAPGGSSSIQPVEDTGGEASVDEEEIVE